MKTLENNENHLNQNDTKGNNKNDGQIYPSDETPRKAHKY